MSDEISQQKTDLRRLMRGRLAALTDVELTDAEAGILKQLGSNRALRDVKIVLAFHPNRNEIGTLSFIKNWIDAKRTLLLPRVASDGITLKPCLVRNLALVKPGYRGIHEPVNSEECAAEKIEAVLVPGLAYDAAGRRLGQGGGHYDRLLATLPAGCVTIGLAYDWQIVNAVPTDTHDVAVQHIVTPQRWIVCTKKDS